MTDFYIVVVVDRHTDPEVTPFINKRSAETYAQGYASAMSKRNGFAPEDYEHDEQCDGLIRTITYSYEEDCVHIYKRQLIEKVSDNNLTTTTLEEVYGWEPKK